MKTSVGIDRREAIALLAGTAVASLRLPAFADVEDIRRRSGLGLVIYTQNIVRRARKALDGRNDLFEPLAFLEHCRQFGAGGMQIPLGVLEPADGERLRAKAADDDIFIEAIISPPFDEARLDRFEQEVVTAKQAGADVARTVILPGRRYERFQSRDEFDRFVERGRRALERAKPIVERHELRLAVENHKDQRLDERIDLLNEIDSPMIGACVDTGNSFALLEDPLEVVEAFAPHAFTVHLKDQAVKEYEDGFLFADVALGDGFLDLEAMVDTLRRAQPDIRFSLESITRDALKVPCLSESYWSTFADVPGRDLARTLKTVRSHRADSLCEISSRPVEEQIAIEKETVAQSLEYARTTLGI